MFAFAFVILAGLDNPPMMKPPTPPGEVKPVSPRKPDPVTALVEFIRRTDVELKERQATINRWNEEARTLDKNGRYVGVPIPESRKKEWEPMLKRVNELYVDRREAVKELTAKIGIVKVRELGIR